MTENRWADPAGFPPPLAPPAVAYRILDRRTGTVVTHRTSSMWDSWRGARFRALDEADQEFAAEIRTIIQRACRYFYAPDGEYVPMGGWNGCTVTDDEVRARIDRLDRGENSREAYRDKGDENARYPLDRLPWAQQRALVEQIERVKAEWRFEIIGEVDGPAELLAIPQDYMAD